jgi:hypothetical protein
MTEQVHEHRAVGLSGQHVEQQLAGRASACGEVAADVLVGPAVCAEQPHEVLRLEQELERGGVGHLLEEFDENVDAAAGAVHTGHDVPRPASAAHLRCAGQVCIHRPSSKSATLQCTWPRRRFDQVWPCQDQRDGPRHAVVAVTGEGGPQLVTLGQRHRGPVAPQILDLPATDFSPDPHEQAAARAAQAQRGAPRGSRSAGSPAGRRGAAPCSCLRGRRRCSRAWLRLYIGAESVS